MYNRVPIWVDPRDREMLRTTFKELFIRDNPDFKDDRFTDRFLFKRCVKFACKDVGGLL